MVPKKRTTRASPATTTTTTPVTNVQLKALIEQGISDALAVRDANRIWNGNDNYNSGTGSRTERTACECTYTDFLKCQPMNFKDTEGVVRLTQCFERMDTVFNISNCAVENQVNIATCTLHGVALTWWKSHVKTVGQDAAYGMPCNTLMKMMIAKRMFLKESDKTKKYVGGLPDMIHGSVMVFKPKTMQDAFEDTSRNNQNQQQQNKRQNTYRAYTARSGEKKPYGGSKPLYSKCNYHHDGHCSPKCHKCNRVSHLVHDCRSPVNANTANNQRGTGAGQKATCVECGAQGHFKKECPKLKNNNRGNPANAPAKVYAVGHARTNPDSNIIMGMFLLNNRYASILFDTGTDRSFMSTTFFSQIDITPTTLDHYSTSTLSIGSVRDERIVRPNLGAFRQRLHKAKLLTLGSSSLVYQEEGWIILNVHQLPRTKQANDEESLSTPKDR
ncbi:putative reverse transcriptase domain-containing protein [Tanacetum coccineum]